MCSESLKINVIKALESEKFKWRTIKGISKEIGLNEDEVLSIIEHNKDVIVHSSVPSKNGEDLYTTKQHFHKYSSAMDKIMGAFKGRLR